VVCGLFLKKVNELAMSSIGPLHLFNKPFQARFLMRPNRFLVECTCNGKTIRAFLPNPGRLQELLFPGTRLYLIEDSSNPLRKTSFTVVAVERDGVPIMLHTHRTNQVARFLIENGLIPALRDSSVVKAEATVGRSRFDFLLHDGRREVYLEVKSCTLVGEKVAMFPDAVTARGARHLQELSILSSEGKRAVVLFIVHWPFAGIFMPDYHTDIYFARTLLKVRTTVEVIPVSVRWNHDLSLEPYAKVLPVPWYYIDREAKDRGSYLIVLELVKDKKINVGKLGTILFKKGFYVYVGSAMVNLTSRIERHQRLRKTFHWHIDFLRDSADFLCSFAIRSSDRLECEIARSVSKIAQWSVKEFGSSDCTCATHLFGFTNNPVGQPSFQKLLQHFRMDRYVGAGGKGETSGKNWIKD
jgi:sugar fermentation stimulation protein A